MQWVNLLHDWCVTLRLNIFIRQSVQVVDSDLTASVGAVWSGSTFFAKSININIYWVLKGCTNRFVGDLPRLLSFTLRWFSPDLSNMMSEKDLRLSGIFYKHWTRSYHKTQLFSGCSPIQTERVYNIPVSCAHIQHIDLGLHFADSFAYTKFAIRVSCGGVNVFLFTQRSALWLGPMHILYLTHRSRVTFADSCAHTPSV